MTKGQPTATSSKCVALLRGINVGGKNLLPMKDLVLIFAEAGCRDVSTYIQSGNVVFTADAKIVAELPQRIPQQVEARFGLRVPVVLRTSAEYETVTRSNPFLKQGASPDTLHVSFLADLPNPAMIAGLDPERSAPDAFAVVGREIYMLLPNGPARTKLTNAYFDSKLKTVSTQRNWRTVLKLAELMK
ncbi:MAG: DUF1697 domain-containing protein [Acidobacteriota bacterium]|nr:DUF1697 domain-containing protein [Acidobacteriota bacterium]